MPEIKENKNLRVSPNIVEAEAAVLGCILINSESMSQAMQIVDEKDFYNPSNATIYENMLLLFENNKTIDYISVIEQLKKNNKLKEVGDAYYITGLTEQAPSTQNVEYYAKLVKENQFLEILLMLLVTYQMKRIKTKVMLLKFLIKLNKLYSPYLKMQIKVDLKKLILSYMMF